jgi:hypothetical protein
MHIFLLPRNASEKAGRLGTRDGFVTPTDRIWLLETFPALATLG